MAHATAAETSARRGRRAESPRGIPARGWGDILWRVKDQISDDRISIVAAGVAFYGLLALFPALVAFVAIYGLVADPQQVESHISAISSLLPAQASEIVMGQLRDLVETDQTTLSLGAIGGVLLALWSSSSAVRNLMQALNVAYDEDEKRGSLQFYGIALLLTLGALLAGAVILAAMVVLPMIARFVGLGDTVESLITYLRWPIVAAAAIAGLAVMYRYGPSRHNARWAWVSWGAVIATVLWLVGSLLFSLYVSSFGNFNETYGSMGAVVVLLLWFLLSAYAVLIGAEINAEMERQTRKDTTIGDREPLGERDAHAADTVGDRK